MSLNVKRQHVERIVITCPMSESKKEKAYCFKRGFNIVTCGPKPLRGQGRYDTSRFRLVAERPYDAVPDELKQMHELAS